MKIFFAAPLLAAGLACGTVLAQTGPQSAAAAPVAPVFDGSPAPDSMAKVAPGPINLNWTPPALATLTAQAAVKSSVTFDRDMLAAASSLLPETDAPTRQAIAKIDGVSLHLLRFGPTVVPDEAAIEAIREAYHQRGWKHLVSTTGVEAGSIHHGVTDLWLVLDGVNVRGAVLLVESPKSLTLATLTGDLSPVDLLHLRGHFGIPRFDGDGFKEK